MHDMEQGGETTIIGIGKVFYAEYVNGWLAFESGIPGLECI